MKKYPKMKPSGVEWIGDVPEDWGNYSLKRLVGIKISDGPHETPEFVENGVPFISAESVKNSKIDFNFKRGFITKEQDIIYSKKCKPQKHDIFIVKSGSTTGKIAIVDTEEDFNIWSPLALVRSNPKLVFPNFLFYAFICDYFQRQIQLFWSFGTQPNIGMGVIESLRVILPSLPEQTAIAYYLDHKTAQIDQAIAEKEGLIELFREERQAIINHAVTKGIQAGTKMKPSGVAWIGDVPEGWAVKSLHWLLSAPLKYGANEPAEDDDPTQPRYIRITDFGDDGKLREDTFKSLPNEKAQEYLLVEGDILFARSGATVGKTFQFKNFKGRACFAGYLIKASADSEKLLSDFLYYFTKSNAYENWKDSIFNQATIQNIGADKYRNLPIPLTSTAEQKEIIAYLNQKTAQIDTAISGIQQEISLLQEYRQALIFEAVTGKVDVRG